MPVSYNCVGFHFEQVKRIVKKNITTKKQKWDLFRRKYTHKRDLFIDNNVANLLFHRWGFRKDFFSVPNLQ